MQAFLDSRRKLLDGGLKKYSDIGNSEGDVQVVEQQSSHGPEDK